MNSWFSPQAEGVGLLEDAGNSGLADPGESIPSVGGVSGAQTNPERRVVNLTISSDHELECFFWMGLFKGGTLNPQDIYEFGSIEEIFESVATEGVREEAEPLMITDTSVNPARVVYLVPSSPGQGLSSERIEDVTHTLRSWAPTSLGLYLSAEICGQELASELLQKILRRLIVETPIKRFYLLAGKLGVNQVLNAALKLKFDVEDDDLNIMIFH